MKNNNQGCRRSFLRLQMKSKHRVGDYKVNQYLERKRKRLLKEAEIKLEKKEKQKKN